MPAAVEALGISVGAAAEHGLPRRHWGGGGEDSMIRVFLNPQSLVRVWGQVGPKPPALPLQPNGNARGGGGECCQRGSEASQATESQMFN